MERSRGSGSALNKGLPVSMKCSWTLKADVSICKRLQGGYGSKFDLIMNDTASSNKVRKEIDAYNGTVSGGKRPHNPGARCHPQQFADKPSQYAAIFRHCEH